MSSHNESMTSHNFINNNFTEVSTAERKAKRVVQTTSWKEKRKSDKT